MNKGKSFEGFEVTMNEVRMSLKMHSSIALGLIFIGIAIVITQNCMAYGMLWKQYIHVLWEAVKTNNRVLLDQTIHLLPSILWLSKPVILMVCIGIIPADWLAIKFFKYQAIRQRMSTFIRGAKLMPISWVNRKLFFTNKNIPIGDTKLPVQNETSHVFVIGRTRSGKSQVLKRVVHSLKERHRIIVYENKGDFVPSYYDPDKDTIFCPVDQRSVKWSIWNDIKTVMDIDQIVCWSLIPQDQNKDPFWPDAARRVFKGGLYYLLRNKKGKISNKEIHNFFSLGADHIAACLKEVPEGQSGYEMISRTDSKQTQGVMATLINYIDCLRYIEDQDGDFSIRDWIRQEGPGTLFLMNIAYTKDVLKPLLTLMLDIASQEILSMQEDLRRRRYIILDEFGTLHQMNSIIELLTRGGGMGASVWIGIQDIGQIDQRYGVNLRKSIINSCGTKLILCVDEADTKEYLSEMIGDTEVSEVNDTNSMGLNSFRDGKSIARSSRTKRLILPSELDNQQALTGILKLPALPYTRIRIPIVKHPAQNEQVVLREDLQLDYLITHMHPNVPFGSVPASIGPFEEQSRMQSQEINLD